MLVAYIRVSSFDQNPERQLDGVKVEKKFIDHASGKNRDRPKLEELLNFVREGDTVIVHSMDRLARNLADLRVIIDQLTEKKVKVKFLKENLEFTGEDSHVANLMLSIMGAVAEFERALSKERQKEGIALAKKKGLYTGRKPTLSEVQKNELISRANAGENKAALAREFNISRAAVYDYLKRSKQELIKDTTESS